MKTANTNSNSKDNSKNQAPQKWSDVGGKIKAKFSKLSTDDIAKLEGKIENLPAKVIKAYGYDKQKAEQECREFMPEAKR
ncbi:MAG: hypothetical protein ACOVP4_11285 [Bacteriovoracaceae bacterium]